METIDPIKLFSDYMRVVHTPSLDLEHKQKRLGVINGANWVSLWSDWFACRMAPDVKIINVGNEAVQLNFMESHHRGEAVPPEENIRTFIRYAHDLYRLYRVDAILISCSTMNRTYKRVAAEMEPFGVTVVQIDQAMMEQAIERGGRILIVTTHGPTVQSTQLLLEETAERMGRKVLFTEATIEDAFDLLGEGRIEEHNRKIAKAIETAASCEKINTVILAQLSMSVFSFSYPNPVKTFGIPVLNSGETGFARAAEILAR